MEVRILLDLRRKVSEMEEKHRFKLKGALNKLKTITAARFYTHELVSESASEDGLYIFQKDDLRLYLSRASNGELVLVDVKIRTSNR